MKLRLELAFLMLGCSALGLATGIWLIPHEHPSLPEASASDGPHESSFDAATIEGLGIATTPLLRGTFRIERGVAATVADLPTNRRELYAPIGGVVLDVVVEPGSTVDPGAVLVRIQRDAIPPPRLDLTREHAFPNHDEIHAAFGALRTAETAITTDQDEFDRLRALEAGSEGQPLMPRQRAIELGYALRRNRAAAQQARHELERHGFTESQIEAVLADREAALFDGAHARRALVHSGMWGDLAQSILDALPEAMRAMPLAVGAIAELVAHRAADAELVSWLQRSPADAARFLTIASLLLDGRTTTGVEHLAALSALDEVVELRAPPHDGPWDVPEIHVRPGAPVRSAETLLTLRDPRRMRLVAEPIGSDLTTIRDAFSRGARCRARSVPAGIGPDLTDLAIATLQPSARGVTAWVDVGNIALPRPDDGIRMRSWSLQPGMHYELLLTVEELAEVWIVPRSAIVDRGATRTVFIAEPGGHFHPQAVVVVAEDGDRATIRGPTGGPCELVDGCPIVSAGAYALALAQRGDAETVHAHDH